MKNNKMTKRILMSVFGVLTGGVSVGFFKVAAFGVDPFQTVMNGLDVMIPIGFGTLYLIANAVLLLFSFFADRHYIGIATFINLFLLGYVVEYSHLALANLFPDIGLVGRVGFMIIGIVILCFASSFYFVANLGVSTYDAISLIISKTWRVIDFKFCRIISDIICVIVGSVLILLSGGGFSVLFATVGVGTIITAFFMGPLIDVFVKKVATPFLER